MKKCWLIIGKYEPDEEWEINHFKVRNNPFVKAIEAWNTLPVNVRNAERKVIFKTQYKTTLQNPYKK